MQDKDIPPMPLPAFPMIPVAFHYTEGDALVKSFHAVCSSVPRVGEYVAPEHGTHAIVYGVFWRAVTHTPGKAPTLTPQVFLRDADEHEASQFTPPDNFPG